MQTEQKRVRTTPGPWRVYEVKHAQRGWTTYVGDEAYGMSHVVVAEMPVHWTEMQEATEPGIVRQRANAQLIAAAPQMRSALELIVEEVVRSNQDKDIDVDYIHTLASLALSKAKLPFVVYVGQNVDAERAEKRKARAVKRSLI